MVVLTICLSVRHFVQLAHAIQNQIDACYVQMEDSNKQRKLKYDYDNPTHCYNYAVFREQRYSCLPLWEAGVSYLDLEWDSHLI